MSVWEPFFFSMGVSPRALAPERALAMALLAQTHFPWLESSLRQREDATLADYARRAPPFCPETFSACLAAAGHLAERSRGHALFDAFHAAAGGLINAPCTVGLFLFGFFRQTKLADEAGYVRAVRALPEHRNMTEAVRNEIASLYEAGGFTEEAFHQLVVQWGV